MSLVQDLQSGEVFIHNFRIITQVKLAISTRMHTRWLDILLWLKRCGMVPIVEPEVLMEGRSFRR